ATRRAASERLQERRHLPAHRGGGAHAPLRGTGPERASAQEARLRLIDRRRLKPGRTTMCGIVGYVGKQDALPILIAGLRRLEYRGYDSAGVALVGRNGLHVHKTAGR